MWGVAQLFGFQDLDSIANLRRGLQFGKPRTFRSVTSGSSSGMQSKTKSSFSKGRSRSRGSLSGLGISKTTFESSSLERKGKREGETFAAGQPKRCRSSSSRGRIDITNQFIAERAGGAEGLNKYSIEEAKVTSLMRPRDVDDRSFDNRIFS